MNRPYTVNNYPEGEFMSQGGSLTAAQAYQVLKRSEYGADYSFDWMVALGLVGNGGLPFLGTTYVLSPRITQAGRGNYC